MTAIVPNFFIVGAPKCGTTAMSLYLQSHPNVFMAYPKEPHHFAADLAGLSRIESRADYHKLFQKRDHCHLAVGDASVWHLYSRNAIAAIWHFNKDARLIVMLRNPLCFLRSYHNHMVFSLIEVETNFETAWALQEQRANGDNIPPRCRMPWALQYAKIAQFGYQVERLLSVFPRNKVHFIIFEDFVASPLKTYLALLDFLDIPYDGRFFFPKVNEARTHRSRIIATLLLNPPAPLRCAWSRMKGVFGPGIIRHTERAMLLNARPKPAAPLSPAAAKVIRLALQNDVDKLSFLIGRDLTEWL